MLEKKWYENKTITKGEKKNGAWVHQKQKRIGN